jgi:hypothetical protein
MEPGKHERPPCPECQRPGKKILYKGAIIASPSTVQTADGTTKVAISIMGVQSVLFMPCGHEFDGKTAQLIEAV